MYQDNSYHRSKLPALVELEVQFRGHAAPSIRVPSSELPLNHLQVTSKLPQSYLQVTSKLPQSKIQVTSK